MILRVLIGLCVMLCAGLLYVNLKGYSMFGGAEKIEKGVTRKPGSKGGVYRGGGIYHK